MKEYQLQTPKQDHPYANRRSKSISDYNKKTQKISKKCLDSAFTSVSEDFSLESPIGSIELSSMAEICEDHLLGEFTESSIVSPNLVISRSLETVAPSDLSPLSTITGEEDEPNNLSVVNSRSAKPKNSYDIVAVETDMVLNHLKKAQSQLRNSTSCDVHSKKLLDALIKLVIEEFHVLPEEKVELTTLKIRVVFTSILLWILVVSVIFLLRSSGVQSSFSEPPPT